MLQGLMQIIIAVVLFAVSFTAHATILPEESDIDLLSATIPDDNKVDDVTAGAKDSHYTIDEASTLTPQNNYQRFSNPIETLSVTYAEAKKTILSSAPVFLTRWIRHSGPPEKPAQSYNRLKHYGRWINDPTDNECLDTRAKVLVRDSSIPVTYKRSNKCRVVSGLWKDPYSGKTLTEASDLQIDHFVPLKNSYVSGAWKWEPLKRCLFANFTSNTYHLIPVYGFENMSKGDSTPEDYLPSNKAFTCDYLQRWLKVKLIWNLTMTSSEADSIRNEFQRFNCDQNKMKMSRKELLAQRKEILGRLPICEKKARGLRLPEVL